MDRDGCGGPGGRPGLHAPWSRRSGPGLLSPDPFRGGVKMHLFRSLPLAGLLLASAPLLSGALHGQLPAASPATAGMAGSSMAATRGAAALGINPAALALPSGPGWSLILPSASLLTGLDPVTGADLGNRSGETLSREERVEWLERIATAGRQRGQGGAN